MVKQEKTLQSKPEWLVQFGQRLERARGQMGLTQTELAGSDLSKSFVSLLETARSYPSVDTLLLLARRSGTSVGALLLESEELRLDGALNLLAIARSSAWRRPSWARGLLEQVKQLLPDMPLWVRAEASFVRGLAFVAENRLGEAEKSAQQARGYAEKAAFGPGKARATALLGYVTLMRREIPKAVSQLSEAVAAFRASGSLRSEFGIRALLWLGTASVQAGRVRYARGIYEKARRLAVRLGFRALEGRALWGLGHQAWAEGDLPRAARLMRDARKAFEETEDLRDLGDIMRNLGVLLREQGKLGESREALDRSIRLADEVGNLRMRSAARHEMACLHLQLGDHKQARLAAQQAEKLAKAAEDKHYQARALATLGRIEAGRGERTRALRQLGQAARMLKALGIPDEAASVERDLGLLRTPPTAGTEVDHFLAQALASTARPAGKRGPHRGRRSEQRTR